MKQKYNQIIKECKNKAKLIVVSKYRKVEELQYYYDLGQRSFAENRVQELLKKKEQLPNDIKWHMIGHLQSNKVKYIAPFIAMIHSVDSISLLKEIDKQAKKHNRNILVLIQINIANEESKSGIQKEELFPLMKQASLFTNITVKGIMVIGPHTHDANKIEAIFKEAYILSDTLKKQYPDASELSMGMSQDYLLALKHHATMIRIGSILFQ